MCKQTISAAIDYSYLNYLDNCTDSRLYPPLRLDEDENFIWIDGMDSKKASISKSNIEANIDGQDYTNLEDIRRALLINISKVNAPAGLGEISDQIDEIIKILGDEEVPFERNTGVDELLYQTKGTEYLVFLFRTNPSFDLAFIEKYDVSCLSSNNDNYLIKIGFSKIYSHSFVDSNFSNVDNDSKLQVAIPGQNSVPAIVTSSGFDPGGRDINSKFGKGREKILFEGKNPIRMPKNIFYMAITITPMSNGANIATSLNWSERAE
jgi:hypothetical protein